MFQSAPALIRQAITRQRLEADGLILPVNGEVTWTIAVREQRCLVQHSP